ncbi:unnamed protein product, partial [Rotaria magnacalcarata]
ILDRSNFSGSALPTNLREINQLYEIHIHFSLFYQNCILYELIFSSMCWLHANYDHSIYVVSCFVILFSYVVAGW